MDNQISNKGKVRIRHINSTEAYLEKDASNRRHLLVNSTEAKKNRLLAKTLQEKFGEDIILVTPQEALENNISHKCENIMTFKLEPQIEEHENLLPQSGKDRRRVRREFERKSKKAYLK
jgi:hypothetical protein